MIKTKADKIFAMILSGIFTFAIGLSTLFAVLNVNNSIADGGGGTPLTNATPIISAGSDHTIAIFDGELWSWGENTYGQLGDGTNSRRTTPAKISTETNWVNVSTGINHSLAINTAGELYSWGNNSSGQLGLGDTDARNIPTRVGDQTNWVSISSGGGHSLGLNDLGEMYAWGYNFYGQLGDGTGDGMGTPNTDNDKNTPVQIGTATNWVSISAGGNNSLAINELGELYAWGSPSGNGMSKNTPQKIGNETNWISISAGNNHVLAINSLGELWAWGSHYYGESFNSNYPIRIGEETNWVTASAGNMFSHVINTAGELWAWGSGQYDVLGDGTNETKKYLVKIGDGTSWVNVVAGNRHVQAINNDGVIYAWGYNTNDTLGFHDYDVETPTVVFGGNVSVPSSHIGFTISAPSMTRVPYGHSYTFKITLNIGYSCPIIRLNSANGKINLSSIDKNVYTYTVSNVQGDITSSNFTRAISLII